MVTVLFMLYVCVNMLLDKKMYSQLERVSANKTTSLIHLEQI